MSGEINWGPEIAVEGKRPEWLGDGEDVMCFTTVWHSAFLIPHQIDWPIIRKIKLRADHSYYAAKGLDTTDTLLQPVDFSAPIEAVHEDGRVSRDVRFEGYDRVRCRLPTEFYTLFNMEGIPVFPECGWRIRNVAQATETGSTAPSGGEVGPEYPKAEIEALVRDMAGYAGVYSEDEVASDWVTKARAIVALLPEPVDADILTARKICAAHAENNGHPTEAAEHLRGRWDGGSSNRLVRATLDHLRSLEKGEAA